MYSKSDNIKFMPYDNSNEVFNELFELILSRYQGDVETSIELSEFSFDSVQLLYYKCYRVNFRGAGSCIDSPD